MLALIICEFFYFLQLIIAVAGVLTGYNGSFEFKEPGQEYGEYPYVGMRVVSCFCSGILLNIYSVLFICMSLHVGVCSYGYCSCPTVLSYCLGASPVQYRIFLNSFIDDL